LGISLPSSRARRESVGGMANARRIGKLLLLVYALRGFPSDSEGPFICAEFSGGNLCLRVRVMPPLADRRPFHRHRQCLPTVLAVLPFNISSTLAGGFASAMRIPITFPSTEEFLRAWGAPPQQALREVLLHAPRRQHVQNHYLGHRAAAYRGISRHSVVPFARVAGENSPLLFTALRQ